MQPPSGPCRRNGAAILIALLSCLPAVTPADARPESCDHALSLAAAASGDPAAVLRATALVEPGRSVGGRRQPWPWAINHAGEGRWFETRAEARAHAESVLAQGAGNFDVGCFQLNYRWHGAAFPDLDAMLDPVRNARYAADFLTRLYHETGDWTLAAGAYHSRTPQIAETYRAKVAALLETTPAPTPPPRANAFPLLRGGRPLGQASLVPQTAAAGRLLPGALSPLFGG